MRRYANLVLHRKAGPRTVRAFLEITKYEATDPVPIFSPLTK